MQFDIITNCPRKTLTCNSLTQFHSSFVSKLSREIGRKQYLVASKHNTYPKTPALWPWQSLFHMCQVSLLNQVSYCTIHSLMARSHRDLVLMVKVLYHRSLSPVLWILAMISIHTGGKLIPVGQMSRSSKIRIDLALRTTTRASVTMAFTVNGV